MTNLRLSYQTVEFGKIDIHVCTLRNRQEFYDPDGAAEKAGINSTVWPLFGVIWPSSLVLAHFMNAYDVGAKRVLEVGCGMALSSLLLNKQNVDITATDYHPESRTFLKRNTLLNGDVDIAFEQANWAETNDTLGLFDLIIGSDVVYEDEHAGLLGAFIAGHAKPSCEVVIVDPGRGRKNKLSAKLEEFNFSVSQSKPEHTDYLDAEFKGYILRYNR